MNTKKKTLLLTILAVASFAAATASGCGGASRPKIIVVGLDGLSWNLLDPLVKAHQLPNIEGVLSGAASGAIETFRPTHSAILWTSIATGKVMEKHGITDFTYVDEEAREEIERLRLVTGTRRTAATIWEILGDKGRSVGVVNWWVTYPAVPVNGVLVSDRLKVVMNKKSVAQESDLVYPPSLIEELRPMFLSTRGAVRTMRKFGFPRFRSRAAAEMFHSSPPSRHLYEWLHSYVGQDQMVASWALHLLRKGQPDFFGVVLRIADVYAHFAWRFADRATLERIVPQVGLESLTSGDEAVRNKTQALVRELDAAVATALLPAYRFVDEFVGAVVSTMDPDSILVIVSDHGHHWQGGAYDHNPSSSSGGTYPAKSPPGVLIIKGKGIGPVRVEGARLFDVTPTILYALGEPIARDMDGRAIKEVFREPLLFGRRAERFVPTYGTGTRQAKDSSPSGAAEQEILEDLRSLGYINPGPSRPSGSASPSKPPDRKP